MTDQETLRPKYKAGYNLHPEIGNILLEVDTDAKTVTPSLEPDSPYTLTGGGGGGSAEYVIPAQDAAFVTELESVNAFVSNVNIEGLDDGAMVVGKVIFNNRTTFKVGTYTQSAEKLEFEEFGNIRYRNNAWVWKLPNVSAGTVINLTVIKNF